MQALSPLQHDALVELFNIGVGQAASALADIVGEEVTMSVPTIRFVGRARACALLAGADGIDSADGSARVCGVRQRYDACRADDIPAGRAAPSAFHTEAIVIFAEHASLDIVRLMVGDGVSFEELTAMEQEAMGEIGNIVLNACVGTLANLLGQELRGSLPMVQVGSSAAILAAARGDGPHGVADPIIMLLQIDLALEAQQIRGYIAFLLEMDAMDGLRELVDSYLAQLAGGAAALLTAER
jgi:chemotaxis protein CheC